MRPVCAKIGVPRPSQDESRRPVSMLCSGPMKCPATIAIPHMRAQATRLLRGETAPWTVWWLLGPPVLAGAVWLGIWAEDLRYDEAHFWGAMLATLKFMLCLFWLTLAW